MNDLFEQAGLVALGTITGKSEPFQIEHVSGGIANFTDYYFTISKPLRGESRSNTVTVRVQGGTVGNYTEIYEHSPNLNHNEEYLLFLYQPGRGGAYNTIGDYYYILGLTQGTYTRNSSGDFISASGMELTASTIMSAIDYTPVDDNYFRNEYISNQRRNLENGFITQEEYDKLMSDIDKYATIVNSTASTESDENASNEYAGRS